MTDKLVGARVRIDGLQARPELNGSLGVVQSHNEETGRYNVIVDDMRDELALKVAALTVAEEFAGITLDTKVRIACLEKMPELNGKVATVSGFQGDRCVVYVDDLKETVALKREALVIAQEASHSKGSASEPRTVRVECNGIMLKLTVSPKQLQKPFADAVLKPFLKAYSKKVDPPIEPPLDTSSIRQVTIDSDGQRSLQVMNDIHIYSAAAVLENLEGDVDVDVFLKSEEDLAPKEAPKEAAPPPLPKDARVLIHGLNSEAGKAMNGLKGRVTGYNAGKGRYDVTVESKKCDHYGKVVSCRAFNLRELGPKELFEDWEV